MDTNEAGFVLLATTGVAGLAVLHPLLLFLPVTIAVLLFFVGARDLATDTPRSDVGP